VAVLKSILGAKKESRTFFVGAFKVGWGCSTGLMAVSEAEFNGKVTGSRRCPYGNLDYTQSRSSLATKS
jgi:hypothetical protein